MNKQFYNNIIPIQPAPVIEHFAAAIFWKMFTKSLLKNRHYILFPKI